MTVVPVVTVHTGTVESLLTRLTYSTGPASMMRWLAGPMTQSLQLRARERFAMEGDAASGPWEPLREATQSFREAGGFGAQHPINRRTGEMERYIVGANPLVGRTPDGAMLQWPGSEAGGILGEKVRTAQQGKSSPKTPARPVVAADTTDLEMALMSLAGWIISGIETEVA